MSESNQDESIGMVQQLLRGEISAIETYDQVLEKFRGKTDESALKAMREEHVSTQKALRALASNRGEVPEKSSGVWGSWAKFTTGTAKIFGEAAALKALKEGEEHGLKEYQSALGKSDIEATVKSEIESKFIPAQQKHIANLDQLISKH